MEEPGLEHLGVGEPLTGQVVLHVFPAGGAETKSEGASSLCGYAPLFKVGPGVRALFRVDEVLVVELGYLLIGSQEGVHGFLGSTRRCLYPQTVCQRPQRLCEVLVLRLHHEADSVSALGARTETPPTAALREHDERRRPLRVEGAASFQVASGLRQRRVPGYNLYDVQSTFYVVQQAHCALSV